MEKIDMIYDICQENQKDIKEIAKAMPNMQTKEDCEKIRKENKNIFSGNMKYIITIVIAASAVIVAIIF